MRLQRLATLLLAATISFPSWAACPPLRLLGSPPATELEKLSCSSGIQEHQELEIYNIEKTGSGRIILSILVVRQEERSSKGLVIRIGPYGEEGDRFDSTFIDFDEIESLSGYIQSAIVYSARKNPGLQDDRFLVFRTKDDWYFVASMGNLGGISLNTRNRFNSYRHEIVFTPDETRAFLEVLREGLRTLINID